MAWRRPPPSVAFVARTHWLVAGVIAASLLLLHFVTRNLPYIEFHARTYFIVAALGGFYGLSGALVWFGLPTARVLSRVCALLYLARPDFGSHLWEIMNSAEFQSHFERKAP